MEVFTRLALLYSETIFASSGNITGISSRTG
jgi:hypothetical protein